MSEELQRRLRTEALRLAAAKHVEVKRWLRRQPTGGTVAVDAKSLADLLSNRHSEVARVGIYRSLELANGQEARP